MSKIAERLTKCFGFNDEGDRVVFAATKGEDYEALSNLIHSLNVDEDMAYNEVLSALDSIAEHGVECIEVDYYDYCEPDIYTHDLLEWVSKNLNNVAWCDEAMSVGLTGDKNSLVDIIMAGQSMAKEYVWRRVIGLVQEMEDEVGV